MNYVRKVFGRGWINNDNDELIGRNVNYYLYTSLQYTCLSPHSSYNNNDSRYLMVGYRGDLGSYKLGQSTGGVLYFIFTFLELC